MPFQPLYNVFTKIENISNFIYGLGIDDICVNCENDHVIITNGSRNTSIVLLDYVEARLDSNHDVVGIPTDFIQAQIGMKRTEYIDKNQSVEVITKFLTDLIKAI